jgi:hypothetical protein
MAGIRRQGAGWAEQDQRQRPIAAQSPPYHTALSRSTFQHTTCPSLSSTHQATGFTLECNANPATPITTVTNEPVIAGTNYSATLPLARLSQFFRLHEPLEGNPAPGMSTNRKPKQTQARK